MRGVSVRKLRQQRAVHDSPYSYWKWQKTGYYRGLEPSGVIAAGDHLQEDDPWVGGCEDLACLVLCRVWMERERLGNK